MKKFKKQYRDLEQNVLSNLRYEISISKEYSKHCQTKCIKVNVFDYTELANINDQLTFIDAKGLQYSLWNGDCNLEDFIDILNNLDR